MKGDEIEIKLSKNKALVLFEFLHRFSDNDKLNIEHQSEERVLWDILGDLEKKLVEPFSPKYLDILNKARESVRDHNS